MKKILSIILVFYGFCSYAQSQICCDKPEFHIHVLMNKEIEEDALLQQDELTSVFETYNIVAVPYNPHSQYQTIFNLAGCGDEEQAAKDLNTTDLFLTVTISQIIPIHNEQDAIHTVSSIVLKFENPVSNVLKLTLQTNKNEIKIFDLQGKRLLQQNIEQSSEVNVSMLPKGTYVLVVNDSESLTFIKQ